MLPFQSVYARIALNVKSDPDTAARTPPDSAGSALERLRLSLARVTSGGRHIPLVDGLRLVAIAAVVLFHLHTYVIERSPARVPEWASSPISKFLETGRCGVELFFVISGFILALPFAEQRLAGAQAVSLRRYYLRRVTRLEPPYIVNLLIAFVLLVVAGKEAATALWPHLAASLCYVHNLVFGTASRINAVAWSLEIEVQFYVLAPLLAAVFSISQRSTRRVVLVGAIAAMVGLKLAFPPEAWGKWNLTLPAFIDYFLVGFLLADLYVADWRGAPVQQFRWDALGVLAWAAIPFSQMAVETRPLMPVLAFAACLGSFRGPMLAKCLSLPWCATIGGMCYTIYLYHYFVISAVGRMTIGFAAGPSLGINLAIQAALICPVIVVVGAVLFVAVEKPCMRHGWWKTDFRSRWQAAVGAIFGDRRASRPQNRVGLDLAGPNRHIGKFGGQNVGQRLHRRALGGVVSRED